MGTEIFDIDMETKILSCGYANKPRMEMVVCFTNMKF